MTPQHSTLRISALYHARGMVSQSAYRAYRGDYLEALIKDAELPELPNEWHEVAPGTHSAAAEQEEPDTSAKSSVPRTVVVVLAVVALAIGGLIALMDLS